VCQDPTNGSPGFMPRVTLFSSPAARLEVFLVNQTELIAETLIWNGPRLDVVNRPWNLIMTGRSLSSDLTFPPPVTEINSTPSVMPSVEMASSTTSLTNHSLSPIRVGRQPCERPWRGDSHASDIAEAETEAADRAKRMTVRFN